MLAANLHRDFTPSSVCDKPLIHLSHTLETEQPGTTAQTTPTAILPATINKNPNQPPPPNATQISPEEDPVSENILLSTPDPASLAQEKALQGDIMCRGFYE